MTDIELVSFKIISEVGTAKSFFMEAIAFAQKNNFVKARKLIEEGENHRILGHETHFELIQKEASGEPLGINLILMHAEDQLMAAETIKILAEQLIKSYEIINELAIQINK
ncbi:PTS lactose/cellobiose transporter subunit IIA [Erysipelothrix amsterdamensis]|uniref:PTS lactose/cellobiose transporter subunit IIA n=1 Tax=Erysipelothrix amsterdamensis TaxID=2929157 RepID=A0AAU9VIY9_9FIRM|nr:PTS lactose/cellobiose transporter subunit IIA [Erysipelothrix sp. strain 2 (EsS2-6-Brazil)]MDE8053105.1 PTS lactose/cellobiose transporter subunit IIA [Erysipelothrix rhusiopathiae]CAH2762101.1 PTS lactose/cellobiose transporter subunit IIA [Erysipelothrix sp. A18Y020d]MBK2401662.1 PTS lactose/cellobiose transporter subunit IIA [Erysipelothrix sp. strain 2 (EsS2-6-Brazil)]MDE8065787.1 PTS lactose/cellobiose transporter subunit IIA [Erysipelothrix rhusiopathiae]MDE8073594.1 PTS lactose/cell